MKPINIRANTSPQCAFSSLLCSALFLPLPCAAPFHFSSFSSSHSLHCTALPLLIQEKPNQPSAFSPLSFFLSFVCLLSLLFLSLSCCALRYCICRFAVVGCCWCPCRYVLWLCWMFPSMSSYLFSFFFSFSVSLFLISSHPILFIFV